MKDKLNLQITLIMRFQIDGMAAQVVAERWLRGHPEFTWSDLRNRILQNLVIYRSGELVDNPIAQPHEPQSQVSNKPTHNDRSRKMNYRGASYQPDVSDTSQSQLDPQKPLRVYRGQAY